MNRILFFTLTTIILTSCQEAPLVEEAPKLQWFKGNTHAHTTLCGHADTHPDTVALWYLDRDYNFLILSEHDQFIDPSSVNLPGDRRDDFILIPGEELSHYNHVHATAMNIEGEVHTHPHEPHSVSNVELLQAYVDSTIDRGGELILNHPNFGKGIPASEIGQVERLHLFELYNGHPYVYNWGTEELPSVEAKWDSLLTAGVKMLGISSDDAHNFKTWGEKISNPGRGWVMVESDTLTADAITASITEGRFYASSGVMLHTIEKNKKTYAIVVDTSATAKAISDPLVMSMKNENAAEGFKIEFIADGGKVVQSIVGHSAKLDIPSGLKYVRAKVSYTVSRDGDMEQFFAWTQPVFLD